MLTDVEIRVTDAPEPKLREAIASGLGRYNDAQAGPIDARPLAVLIESDGDVIGGLWGRTYYRWLYVELLFVPDALRGRDMGARLMASAEAEARARGCIGAWLDTFSFQAPGFYERLGYTRFGQLDDFPPGHARVFLRKPL